MNAHRIFVEKCSEFQVEAQSLKNEFNENLSLSLRTLRRSAVIPSSARW